ncbi:MAG: tetratricopeptide repeat protein [Lysobacterales bacterium]
MSAVQPGSTRFVRMEAMFHQALALPAASRAEFVAASCGDDVALQATLAQMLRYAEDGDTGLGSSISAVAGDWAAPTDRSGERIGPYRLSERIRYGGMAEVYAARRADGEFEQEVAIKIARSDRPPQEMHSLFQSERGVLARLRHPHICQFLDGGTTPAGEPYFVMERLSGVPLPQACRELELPWRAVLAHLLDLCAAVSHIHGQLIVHRDIKPDNVLMASGPTGPVVKLLDFGIAGRLGTSMRAAAGPGGHWYSPEYAAPEVVAGEIGGVAVDVYALGCLLRDLLPLVPAGRRADLAAIVGHACAADATARYASVEALASDVRRVRDRYPISLKRQTGYRLRCFLQRHALGLSIAVLGLTLSGLAWWRELHLRQAAELATLAAIEARDRAGAMRDFLLQAYESANPELNNGSELPVSALLDQQYAALEQNAALAADTRIDLLGTLAGAMMNLGRYAQAEQTIARAIELAEARGEHGQARWALLLLTRAQTAQREDQFERAEALFRSVDQADLAWHHSETADEIGATLYSSWAVVAQRLNHLDQAEALILRALALRQRTPMQRDQASFLVTLGSIQSARGQLPAALDTFERAYAENQATGRRYSFPHLGLLGWIGITLDRMAQPERGEPYLKEAVEVAERLFPKPHPKLSGAYGNLGAMYLVNGRLSEAQPWLQRGLDVLVALGDQRSSVYQTRLHNLGRLALEREDLALAESRLSESLQLRRETVGDHHERTAVALLALANLSLLQRNAERAQALAGEALAIARDPQAMATGLLGGALLTQAEAQVAQGLAPEAEALLTEFAAGAGALGARQRGPLRVQEGRVREALGEVDAAVDAYRDAISAFGGDTCTHPACAQASLRLAWIAADRGDLGEARRRYAQAAPILSSALVDQAPTLRTLRALQRRL